MHTLETSTPLTLEVVTYDPLRRVGFMRVLDAGSPSPTRVHFALSMLPEQFKRPLIVRSRPLNHRELAGERFTALMRELRQELVGARFQARVRRRADGRWCLIRESLVTARPPSAVT